MFHHFVYGRVTELRIPFRVPDHLSFVHQIPRPVLPHLDGFSRFKPFKAVIRTVIARVHRVGLPVHRERIRVSPVLLSELTEIARLRDHGLDRVLPDSMGLSVVDPRIFLVYPTPPGHFVLAPGIGEIRDPLTIKLTFQNPVMDLAPRHRPALIGRNPRRRPESPFRVTRAQGTDISVALELVPALRVDAFELAYHGH